MCYVGSIDAVEAVASNYSSLIAQDLDSFLDPVDSQSCEVAIAYRTSQMVFEEAIKLGVIFATTSRVNIEIGISDIELQFIFQLTNQILIIFHQLLLLLERG